MPLSRVGVKTVVVAKDLTKECDKIMKEDREMFPCSCAVAQCDLSFMKTE